MKLKRFIVAPVIYRNWQDGGTPNLSNARRRCIIEVLVRLIGESRSERTLARWARWSKQSLRRRLAR